MYCLQHLFEEYRIYNYILLLDSLMGTPQHRGTGRKILELELPSELSIQIAFKLLNQLSEKLRDLLIVTQLVNSKAHNNLFFKFHLKSPQLLDSNLFINYSLFQFRDNEVNLLFVDKIIISFKPTFKGFTTWAEAGSRREMERQ